MKIYPYKMASASAKALAEALGIKRIKHEGKPLVVRGGIINWGASAPQRKLAHDGVLNEFDRVAVAANKLQTFQALDGHVPIPDWTEDAQEASTWIVEGSTVVCRTILNGNSGQGIVLCPPEDGVLVPAPLYTKYIKKKEEYRVHVFQGKAIMLQRKARKKDVPDDKVNWQIRNHGNGFIFAHKDVVVPPDGIASAIRAVECLGLDFGAVDLMANGLGQCFVLEVNTAPGLEGETLTRYVEAFKELA